MATAAVQTTSWFQGRTFESWREEFDRRGYLIFERVLSPAKVAEIRAALAPHLARDLKGRNDFEGEKTNRIYALMAKSPVFAELAIHPLALGLRRGRARRELPALGLARDQPASGRNRAALAL
jgi:hypothetical protein